jgi:ABC-type branched-subunit amino acid transport system permease subunit
VNLYWLALAYLVLVYAVVAWVTGSRAGRVWQAIRENERRVEVLGLQPYGFKLLVFVLAGLLASLGGVVHLLLLGGSTPRTTTPDFTLGLLVMVVLGGAGSRWGAVLGGVLYTYREAPLGGHVLGLALRRLDGDRLVAVVPQVVGEARMSSSRTSAASSKQSATSSPGRPG